MKIFYIVVVLLTSVGFGKVQAQDLFQQEIITFEEYLAFVKQYHPLTKQAKLTLTIAEANLLKARGGFDPSLEADLDRKKFKSVEYYDKLNATFKIPTWFGIDFYGDYEDNQGTFLNPENSIPDNGLYSAGVSLSLARGLLTNQRMAQLRKSKYFLEESRAQQSLLINNIIYEASIAYLNWVKAKRDIEIYLDVLENAELRYNSVVRTVREGQEAPIDSTEAKINVQNRQLGLEMAMLAYQKAKLTASNFLWINDIPVEIQDSVNPVAPSNSILANTLNVKTLIESELDAHPKLTVLDNKVKATEVEVNLKKNNLLPVVDLKYNFLSTESDRLNAFNTANYKAQLNFSLPLFLRKERGELSMAKAKLQDARFERANEEVVLKNKIEAAEKELESLLKQIQLMNNMVANYQRMLVAEERKFDLGESSLFLVNSREQRLIDAQLKQNELYIESLEATAKLFNVLGEIGSVL